MRKNVGIRIMKIADIHRKIVEIVMIAIGVVMILAGLVALYAEDFGGSMRYVLLGAVFIAVSFWLAEVTTIFMYGFGIIVAKLEKWDIQQEEDVHFSSQTANVVPSWICCLCGHKNCSDAKFCEECGKEKIKPSTTGWTCTKCGTENELGTHKCKNCGKG